MSRIKRTLCIVLTLVMLVLSFSACGKGSTSGDTGNTPAGDTTKGPQENKMPIANNDKELLIYVFIPNGARQVYQSLADHPVVKEIMKQTGLKLTFMHPPLNDDGTFFNTTIASGVYPDLFQDNFKKYPGGPDGAVQDGVLINMNNLINQYAPNYLAQLKGIDEKTQKKAYSDAGMIIRFGTIFQPPLLDKKVHSGLVMRKDLLDAAKLSIPETIDEFTKALVAIKDSNKVKVPLAMPKASDVNWKNYNPFASAYGVQADDFFLNNGKVAYSRTQAGYKEFLKLLNSWYTQGLLDKDFANKTNADQLKLLNNATAGAGFIGNWQTTQVTALIKSVDPSYDITGVPFPALKKGDALHLSDQMESINDRAWFVSKTCKYPTEAVRLVDYFCKPETNELCAWGIGPDASHPTYTIVNGKKTFTDFMKKNPEMDYTTARDRYSLNPFQSAWVQDMEVQQYADPHNIQCWDAWGKNNDNKNRIPNAITLTPDESRQLSTIMNQINTLSDEYFYKFVTGMESFDKFDEYVKKIEALQINDAVKIEQAAYDRFMKR